VKSPIAEAKAVTQKLRRERLRAVSFVLSMSRFNPFRIAMLECPSSSGKKGRGRALPTDHRTCFCDIVVFFGFLATSLIAKIVESRTTLLGNTLQRSRQRVLRYRTMRERP
jgi:hypothetical protein